MCKTVWLSNLRLVTFDITNTVVHFSRNPLTFYSDEAQKFGHNVDPSSMKINFEAGWKDLNERLPCFGAQNQVHWKDWWLELVIKTFKDSHIPDKDLQNIAGRLIELFKSPECWTIAPEAVKVLDSLKSRSIKTGVITNFDPRVEIILENLKLKNKFDFVINSYDAKMGKPEKAVFDSALKMAGSVNPHEAMHVGDNYELDFKAAKQAGWNAVLVTRKLVPDAEDFRFENMESLGRNMSLF